MITKCPECNKDISDRATSCPYCGFPLLMDRITAKAKSGVGSIGRASHIAKSRAKFIAIYAAKILSIVIALFVSYWLYQYAAYLAPVNMEIRIFLNLFVSLLWAPALSITKRCFGARVYKVTYILLLAFVSLLIFAEYEILGRVFIYYMIPSDQIWYAILAKIVGVIWLGLAYKPKNDMLHISNHADRPKD